MELQIQRAYSALNEGKKASCETDLSSTDLTNRIAECRSELKAAIDGADAIKITQLRAELRELPLLVEIQEATELKRRLDAIEIEMETAADSIRLIDAVRETFAREYEEQVKLLEPFEERYSRAGFELSLMKNAVTLLQIERREKSALLFSIRKQMTEAEGN